MVNETKGASPPQLPAVATISPVGSISGGQATTNSERQPGAPQPAVGGSLGAVSGPKIIDGRHVRGASGGGATPEGEEDMPVCVVSHDASSGGGDAPTYYFPSAENSDAIQLVSGSVWAFFPPRHVLVAKIVVGVYLATVLFATLGALGYPLANHLPVACKEPLQDFFYSFGFFGIGVCILVPVWGRAFFHHMLDALQQGLQPFSHMYDREVTIALGIAVVGATGSALYGLHVAPPPGIGSGSPSECNGAHRIVRSSSFSWLVATGLLALIHVLHYQYMTRSRSKFMESRRIVLY